MSSFDSSAMASSRLCYRDIDQGDLPFLQALMGDREVMAFWPRPFTAAECEEWIRNQRSRYERHGCGYRLCYLGSTGALVGQAGLLFDVLDGEETFHLGYIFGREHWGNGYAMEACRFWIDYAFARYACSRVGALIRPENVRSMRVAERLGMSLVRLTPYKGYEHGLWVLERPPNGFIDAGLPGVESGGGGLSITDSSPH